MRLWVTRTRPAAARTAATLEALGHEALVAPLLELRDLPVDPADPRLGLGAALAFTSARGVEAYARLRPGRDRPVFAVGDATAAAARAAGFASVRSADGDGAALADLLAGSMEARGGVLAPGAREPAFDLETALASRGILVRPLPLYASEPVSEPPSAALQAMEAERLDGVLLHSAAAAAALARLAEDGGFAARLRGLAAFGLSAACASPLTGLLDRPCAIAAAPREAELLALLPRA